MNVSSYQTLVFDCDGVLLDSNRVKTEAFRFAALSCGTTAAERLVQHHIENGGMSRYKKFEYLLDKIVPEVMDHDGAARDLATYDALLAAYAAAVHDGLRTCAVAEGLRTLRAQTSNTRWLVVSGGEQAELRTGFADRKIADYFDGGIFGSPDAKGDIVVREIATGNIAHPSLFLGDSRLDHEVAVANGLDFVFVSHWTEMPAWQRYVAVARLAVVANVGDLTFVR